MLRQIQYAFDSNFLAPRFNIIWSLKICIIKILETNLYDQTRNAQTILQENSYTDNENLTSALIQILYE